MSDLEAQIAKIKDYEGRLRQRDEANETLNQEINTLRKKINEMEGDFTSTKINQALQVEQ